MRLRLQPALLALALAPGAAAQETAAPAVAGERVVFSTDFGDLVFALHPDVAPRHVAQFLRLVQTGAYDGTRFVAVDPGFYFQVSEIRDRLTPLTREQAEAELPLPAEFSKLPHRLGTLSMARLEDPDSARSSFVILTTSAPHLDGKYTVFGYVESGGSTLRKIAELPRAGTTPRQRVTVRSARVIEDLAAWRAEHPLDPLTPLGDVVFQQAAAGTAPLRNVVVPLLGAICLLGLSGFLVYPKLERTHLLSLLMLATLVAGVGLLVLLVPVGQRLAWLAPLLFFGLYGLFRLMSRFETR